GGVVVGDLFGGVFARDELALEYRLLLDVVEFLVGRLGLRGRRLGGGRLLGGALRGRIGGGRRGLRGRRLRSGSLRSGLLGGGLLRGRRGSCGRLRSGLRRRRGCGRRRLRGCAVVLDRVLCRRGAGGGH